MSALQSQIAVFYFHNLTVHHVCASPALEFGVLAKSLLAQRLVLCDLLRKKKWYC